MYTRVTHLKKVIDKLAIWRDKNCTTFKLLGRKHNHKRIFYTLIDVLSTNVITFENVVVDVKNDRRISIKRSLHEHGRDYVNYIYIYIYIYDILEFLLLTSPMPKNCKYVSNN